MASRIALLPDKTEITLASGETDTVHLAITNAGPIVDAFEISVINIDPSWYTLTPSSISLFPGDEADVTLEIHPPSAVTILAGTYGFAVLVTSHDTPTDQARAAFILSLAAVTELNIDIEPQRIVARKGVFTLTLNNEGNTERHIVLRPTDPEERLSFVFGEAQATPISKKPRSRKDDTAPTAIIPTPDSPTVPNDVSDVSVGRAVGDNQPLASRLPTEVTAPNTEAPQGYVEMTIPAATLVQIPVTVKPAKRVWFGKEMPLRFEVAATPPGVEWEAYEAKRISGELVYMPVLAWWSKLPLLLRRLIPILFALLLLGLLLYLLFRPSDKPVVPEVNVSATQTALAQPNVGATLTALALAGGNPDVSATLTALALAGGSPDVSATQTALALAGGGGNNGGAGNLGPMRILKFDWATTGDGSLAVTWEVTNALTVTLNSKVVPLVGVEPVDSTSDRALTLTAQNGKTSISRSLGVLLLKPPEIKSFAADPPEVTSGTGAVISWEVARATEILLDGNKVSGPKGSVSLQPTETQSHTLVAKNDFGQVQSSLTLTVTIPPSP